MLDRYPVNGPQIELRTMTEQEYRAYRARAIQDYADEVGRNESIEPNAAFRHAERSFVDALPEGSETSDTGSSPRSTRQPANASGRCARIGRARASMRLGSTTSSWTRDVAGVDTAAG